MPRTEELSGRKYAGVWIRSAIIRSWPGLSCQSGWCKWAVTWQWYHPRLPLTESRGEMQNNEESRRRNNDCNWCSQRAFFLRMESELEKVLEFDVAEEKWNSSKEVLRQHEEKWTLRAESSRKFNRIPSKGRGRQWEITKLYIWGEMRDNYCVWQKREGTGAEGPRFQMSRRRWRDVGSVHV